MKIERKYMAHYLNANFANDDGTASYVRLGKDLEEYSPELSANVEKKSNILGETSVTIDSYQKQGEVSPYYAEKDDPLFTRLQAIIDGDQVLDDLKTDIVEVKLWGEESAGAYGPDRELYREGTRKNVRRRTDAHQHARGIWPVRRDGPGRQQPRLRRSAAVLQPTP